MSEQIEGRKLLFKGRIGSHLYGTSTPESDEDFVGIFAPNPEDLLGLKVMDEIDQSTKKSNDSRRNTEEDTDIKYYSLPKFIQLLLQNNPNIVEIPFINEENTLFIDPAMEELFENVGRFISKRVYKSFGGYAYSQRTKMIVKKERYTGLGEAIEWIENYFDLSYVLNIKQPTPLFEVESDLLNKKIKYYKGEKDNCESFHKGMDLKMIYTKLKAERDRYGWRVKTDSFEKVGYDVKFGYHLFRLMIEGLELLSRGNIGFPLGEATRESISKIRNCQVPYEELLGTYESLNTLFDVAFDSTDLREKPDYEWANEWLIKYQLEYLNQVFEGEKTWL